MQGSLNTYTYITVQHFCFLCSTQYVLSDRNKRQFYLISTGKITRIAFNMISSAAMRIMLKSPMP